MLGAFDGISEEITSAIIIADNSITILFLLELSIKLGLFGFSEYFRSGWNRLDFTLVLLSVPSLAAWIFGFDLTGWSFFLVFRILRVFKSFRFIKFVPGMSDLIRGVKRALKTSIVIILGFVVLTFIIGVLSCYLFKRVCPEYFGNPFVAFYSTFQVFTMEGWAEIPNQIAENTSTFIGGLSKLYFVAIVIAGGIFGLSLVNSIFVDAMLSDNTDNIESKVDMLDAKVTRLLEKIERGDT
jgi:voltage-gated sodium channel